MGGEKDAVREEERERSAGLHCIAKISRKHTSPSFILLHFPAPSTGLRATACLSFLSISCSIGPWGGGTLCQQENGVCLQRNEEDSPQGTESQEFLPTTTSADSHVHAYTHVV